MTYSKWKVHCVAYCQDCNWSEDGYLIAQDKAREHHNKTGHRITGDIGYTFVYSTDTEDQEANGVDDDGNLIKYKLTAGEDQEPEGGEG